MNKDTLINFALGQLDNLGYELQRRGISGQVNRHNLAALAMTQQQRVKGEITRAELQIGLQKARIQKLRNQANQTIDQILEHVPAPLAAPLNKVRSAVL